MGRNSGRVQQIAVRCYFVRLIFLSDRQAFVLKVQGEVVHEFRALTVEYSHGIGEQGVVEDHGIRNREKVCLSQFTAIAGIDGEKPFFYPDVGIGDNDFMRFAGGIALRLGIPGKDKISVTANGHVLCGKRQFFLRDEISFGIEDD